MKATTLRPGFLLSLKSTIKGGVAYERVDIAASTDGVESIAEWKTKRTIEDKVEYERAIKVRSKARANIARVCSNSAFGLICPESRADDLAKAIAESEAMINAHNATARSSIASIYVLAGRIEADDEKAMKAIASEVRDLMDEMQAGIAKLDPDAIRSAANRARQLGAVLAPEQNAKVTDAIKAARTAATTIIKRVKVSGEDAVKVLASLDTSAINLARVDFLDLDDAKPIAALPAVTEQRFDDIEVTDDNAKPANVEPATSQLDLDLDSSDSESIAAAPMTALVLDLI